MFGKTHRKQWPPLACWLLLYVCICHVVLPAGDKKKKKPQKLQCNQMFIECSQISSNAFFRFPSASWGFVVLSQLLSGSHGLWITSRLKIQPCTFTYHASWFDLHLFLRGGWGLVFSPETFNLESFSPVYFPLNRQLHSDVANTANMPLAMLISVSLFPEIDKKFLRFCLWVFLLFCNS